MARDNADALNAILSELREMRADVNTLRTRLDTQARLTEAKSGEFRAELETIKSTTSMGFNKINTGLSDRLGAIQTQQKNVESGIDAVNTGLRNEMESIKAAVRTAQVGITDLSSRLDGHEANNGGSKKRRRLDQDSSNSSKAEQREGSCVEKNGSKGETGVKSAQTQQKSAKSTSKLDTDTPPAEYTQTITRKYAGDFLGLKGKLQKDRDRYFLHEREGGHYLFENEIWIDVDVGIEFGIDGADSWAVLNKNDWKSGNYGVFGSERLAEAYLAEVGEPDLEVVHVTSFFGL